MGKDPRERGRALRDEGAKLLISAAAGRAMWAARPPLTVTAAGSLDAVVLGGQPRIDVLTTDELAAAAARAHIDLAAATEADEPALQGFVSALRGTAGELLTLEALNDGRLPAPGRAVHAELIAHHHPGVDLAFHDAGGAIVDTANVKIAADPDVALRHFGRHPDVRLVYAPTDTAERLARMGFEVVGPSGVIPAEGPVIVDLGSPTASFDEQVRGALAGTVVDASTPLWQLVPWFGFTGVGIRAVRRLAAGADRATVRTLGAGDAAVAGAASTSGKLAALATGSTLSAIPFALVGAWTAQAAVATRRSWRQAAQRERVLRARLLDLPATR
ncbi:hypothetical protein [Egicoccus sp. AB-alg2]|uniref:hypothetical protein n=1 Tax=Egicoccus sp. AB-alg2 TaxID=3242693 RepID=UPI00359DF950